MEIRTDPVVAFERPQKPSRHPSPAASSEADKWVDVPSENSISIRPALTGHDRALASALIKRMYATRGYHASALPEEQHGDRLTLVALGANTVVGTVTVGFDSEHPLAVDEVFSDEVNSIRMSGRQVCEFTKLAVDETVRSQRVLAAMFHVAYIHAHRIRGCDNLLIEVNPRHVRYYERMLGFKAQSAPRMNGRVGAAAVLLSLDLWTAQSQIAGFGGRSEACAAARTLYPYALAADCEEEVVSRWLGQPRSQAKSRPYAMA